MVRKEPKKRWTSRVSDSIAEAFQRPRSSLPDATGSTPYSDTRLPSSAGASPVTHPSQSSNPNTIALTPSKPRTLRLSQIPMSINESQFREYLGGLACETGVKDDNILAFSLAPYIDWLVATVSFFQEPMIFSRCRPGNPLDFPLPPKLGGVTITIDCDFHGITPLYHDELKHNYDVIAVSGLSGHAFGSWKSRSSHVMWLRDILPKDFPDFRILSWGYESNLEDSITTMSFASFGRQLLVDVLLARETGIGRNESAEQRGRQSECAWAKKSYIDYASERPKNRPLIFVGHSLGGLVIKQALVDAAQGNSTYDKAILRSCIGVFLFGVPNRGLNTDNLLSLVQAKRNASFVNNLMQGSEVLHMLQIGFLRSYEENLKSCFVVSFYEEKDTKTDAGNGHWERIGKPVRMVTKDSATWFMPQEEVHNQVPIFSDHSQLVKFRSRDDPNYLRVRWKMKELVAKTDEILQQRRTYYDIITLLLDVLNRAQPEDFMQMLSKHNQEIFTSQIPRLEPDDPEYYWITKNIDFTEWRDADDPRTLWISGPPQKALLRIAWYNIEAVRKKSKPAHSVLFFFGEAVTSKHTMWKACTQVLLYQILSTLSQPEQYIDIFLSSLRNALCSGEKERSSPAWFRNSGIPDGTDPIFDDNAFSDEELRDALFAVLNKIPGTELLVIGLDQTQPQSIVFIKAVLSFIKNSKLKVLLTSASQDEIETLFDKVPGIKYDEERKECLDVLRFNNTRYQRIEGELKGSLEWIWDHKEYKEWAKSKTSRLLYLEGKPGSGKSTLVKYFKKHIHEHIHENESATGSAIVATFFYSFREGESQQSHYNMLCSILYGIISQDENFFYHIQLEYRKYKALLETESHKSLKCYKSLRKILHSIQSYQTIEPLYLVIDAVDESTDKDRYEILKLILSLCPESLCTIKVFIASRPVVELKHLIRKSHSFIRMQDVNQSDIQSFVDSFLGKPEFDLPKDISRDIKEYILAHAQGVFLWVHLVRVQLFRYILNGNPPADIFAFLEGLPMELKDMYALLIDALEQDMGDSKAGKQMFEWVLSACRPLKVLELRDALAIENSIPIGVSEMVLMANRGNDFERRITKCGCNLIEIKECTVQVMHHTVREFFFPANGGVVFLSGRNAHDKIAISCLQYLKLCVKNTALQQYPPTPQSWMPEHYREYVIHLDGYPLVNYALSHLKEHVFSCTKTEYVARLVSEVCDELTGSPTSSSLLYDWTASDFNRNLSIEEEMVYTQAFKNNLLHVATELQYSRVAELLLIAGAQTESCLNGETPLMLSARIGDVATAQVLLDKKAQTTVTNQNKRTLLHLAAANGHTSMVELLIAWRADMEAIDHYGKTALHLAAGNGHDTTVACLIDWGAQKEIKDRDSWTALHLAARNGHDTTVACLIDRGAHLEVKDRDGWTALHMAAGGGQSTTVQCLVKRGADIEAKDRYERTALYLAARNGYQTVVQCLVDQETDTEATAHENTVLHLAAGSGHDTTIQYLLEQGADRVTEDCGGLTALSND